MAASVARHHMPKKSRLGGAPEGFHRVGLLANALSDTRPDGALSSRPKQNQKKADVAEPPEGFHHVGLLYIAPTGINRFALYIVVRELIESCYEFVKAGALQLTAS